MAINYGRSIEGDQSDTRTDEQKKLEELREKNREEIQELEERVSDLEK